MLSRPPSCRGCSLDSLATGFSHPTGPSTAKILILGEALGEDETKTGTPFVGRAGNKLTSVISRVRGLDRDDCRIYNTIQCRPPNNALVGQWYEASAINHCKVHRDPILNEGHQVVVTVGAVPTKALLGLSKKEYKALFWHGVVLREPQDRFWVVPTFHPSFLLRKPSLTKTVEFDISLALEVAEHGHTPDPAQLIVDPPLDWVKAWAAAHLAAPPEDTMLIVDFETAYKMASELKDDIDELATGEGDDKIIRANFANGPDLGWTVPWVEPYISVCLDMMERSRRKITWNGDRYDAPLLRQDVADRGLRFQYKPEDWFDYMLAWHVLQTDIPKKLGFVAPFYSRFGPWKHLNDSNPGEYAAIDGFQTYRVAAGITTDLIREGQWDIYERHTHAMDRIVLHPAERIGLKVDQAALKDFKEDLTEKLNNTKQAILLLVPDEALKLDIKTRQTTPAHQSRMMTNITKRCFTCEETDISSKHVCKPRCGDCQHILQTKRKTCPECKSKNVQQPEANIKLVEWEVERWVAPVEFNPNSKDDVLRYAEAKKHKLGRLSKVGKSGKQSADEKVILDLYSRTRDPFYKLVLDYRSIIKVKSTYVEGAEKRLQADGRLHPNFLHTPSTLRLSCRNPNLQNVVADRDGPDTPAAGFRKVLIAEEGCVLVESDFAGIEALLVGWFMQDKDYIRLVRLGVHDYLTSHFVKDPADLKWDDAKLAAHLGRIKATYKKERHPCKRTVHLSNYAGTPHSMMANEPEVFTSLKFTKEIQGLYLNLCPGIPKWWDDVCTVTARNTFAGLAAHPYRYRHWFFNMTEYKAWKKDWDWSKDAKRAIAFLPQSTAGAILYDTCLELMDPSSPDYIGDFYQGQTPIRALIHDSILAEVPEDRMDEYCRRVKRVMTRPQTKLPLPAEWGMGEYLTIGCEIKTGRSWGEMAVWEDTP